MATPTPTAKATIAIFGGNGDYGFLKDFQLLLKDPQFLGDRDPIACEHFSIESEKTEHGLIVNYAKYEYVETIFREDPAELGGFPTHFTFIEFATLDDGMKAMWDGFSLDFTSFICTFFPDTGSKDIEKEMRMRLRKTRAILAPDKRVCFRRYLAVIASKGLISEFDSDNGMKAFVDEFLFSSAYPLLRPSRVIQPPGLGKWGPYEGYDRKHWFDEIIRFREEIFCRPLDASFKGPSHWKLSEKTRKPRYEVYAAVFVLPKSEGGAPIAHGDRRTVSDGPNNIEGTFKYDEPVQRPLSPGNSEGMILHFDQGLEYLDLGRRFAVKQDGRLVALGIVSDRLRVLGLGGF